MKYVLRNGNNNDKLVAQHVPQTKHVHVACPHAIQCLLYQPNYNPLIKKLIPTHDMDGTKYFFPKCFFKTIVI